MMRTEDEINTELSRLLQIQKREPPCLSGIHPKHLKPKAIFQKFTNSPPFDVIITEASTIQSTSRFMRDSNLSTRELRGALFQEIAYALLAAQQPETITLLSPENTLHLYSFLYPNTPIKRFHFGLESLKGISVPDGLLVQTYADWHKIIAFCEYTLSSKRQYFINKLQKLKERKKENNSLFAYSECVFVLPSNAEQFHPKRSNGIVYKPVPFTYADFTEYALEVVDKLPNIALHKH